MTVTVAGRAREFVESKNKEYEVLHKAFEEQFWGTKMALAQVNFSSDLLTKTKQQMEAWMANAKNLEETLALLKDKESDGGVEPMDLKALQIFKRTFECYQMPDDVRKIRDEITSLESVLEGKRNTLKTGYDFEGRRVEASSTALRQMLRSEDNEAKRKAAYQGVREIGPFLVANGFPDIVKKRNELAKKLGFEDYYDMKVTQAEGFGKKRLFEMMTDLETKTRPTMAKAIEYLKKTKGENAFEPWNLAFVTSGDTVKNLDPYFPFEKAVLRYAQSFANLGISYQGATLNLDLLDRPNKYANGFCHWPQPTWISEGKKFIPSVANFTSLAIPTAVGSGKVALTTLMHEAGHAAHFANIKQPSPLFSQERAPTSVAYAENQSMFLDSLVDDADWKAKYARDREGKVIPFAILEDAIRQSTPYAVFPLRSMLVVPFFEKALYELTADQVTPEKIQSLADEIEKDICGGLMGRPLLSVPHILSDESSCYYHGYVLAEMSVWQTREHFQKKYGFLTDNPKIGPELTEAYWKCGNSEMFLDLVQALTGKTLVADAWVAEIGQDLEAQIADERKSYEKMVKALESGESKDCALATLEMRVRMVHGDEVIADSETEGSIEKAADKFEAYVRKNYFEGK